MEKYHRQGPNAANTDCPEDILRSKDSRTLIPNLDRHTMVLGTQGQLRGCSPKYFARQGRSRRIAFWPSGQCLSSTECKMIQTPATRVSPATSISSKSRKILSKGGRSAGQASIYASWSLSPWEGWKVANPASFHHGALPFVFHPLFGQRNLPVVFRCLAGRRTRPPPTHMT